MIVKYIGLDDLEIERGKGKEVHIIANIKEDSVLIEHNKDSVCEYSRIWVNGEFITVNTDSLKCEIVG